MSSWQILWSDETVGGEAVDSGLDLAAVEGHPDMGQVSPLSVGLGEP